MTSTINPTKVPPLSNVPDPFDQLERLGKWVWVHLAAPLWTAPDASFPDWSWLLLLAFLALLGFMIWRRIAGIALAYRRPRGFNFVHGAYWFPLALWLLALSLALFTPFISFPPVPEWRPKTLLLLNARQAFLAMGLSMLVASWALVLTWLRFFREKVEPGIHGEAAWAARSEVRYSEDWPWLVPIQVHFRGTRRPWKNGAGLVTLAPSHEGTRRHTLAKGGSGSGKGFFFLGHILGTARTAVIYQDVKGECPHLDHLRSVTKFEPIRWGAAADGGWPSMRWNPLEECRNDPNPVDAYESLAAVLISGEDRDWVPQLARPILAWVLASGRYLTLGELADDFTDRGVETVLKDIGLPGGLLQSLEGKNVKEYIGTTIFSHLAPFRSGWGRAVTSGNDFSLADIIRRGGFVLSAEPVVNRRTPLHVFWGLLFRKMLRATDPMNLTLILDEGLAAGRIPNFVDGLNTLRGKGAAFVFAIQNSAGLREVYGPQGGPAVEEAFANRVTLLNGLNPEDAEALSKRMDTYTRVRPQRNGPANHDRGYLIPLEEVSRRGAVESDRWAVIEMVGATRSGRPIMARLVPSKLVIRKPTPSEIAACLPPDESKPHGSGESDRNRADLGSSEGTEDASGF